MHEEKRDNIAHTSAKANSGGATLRMSIKISDMYYNEIQNGCHSAVLSRINAKN